MTNDIASELAKLHELTGAEFSRQVERIALMKVFHPLDNEKGIFTSGLLQNDDYRNREALARQFNREMAESCAVNKNKWEQVHIAMGVAVYDPQSDRSVNDVIRRADTCMYENKRSRKSAR